MISLTDFLDLVENDTFISIRWSHNELFHYRGIKKNFFDFEEDFIIVSITNSKDDGLIIVIDIDTP